MVSSISSSTSSWAMQRPDSSQMASKIFSKLDTKNQGYIEKTDLESAFSQIGSSDSTSKVDELFAQLDGDSDGKVTQSELADSLKELAAQLDAGFNNMRTGGPGGAGGMPPPPPSQEEDKGLTKDELTAKAKEVSSTDSNLSSLMSTAAANFDAADTDGDGRVTAKEAMAYQQSQQTSSTSSSTATSSASSVTAASDTSSSSSTSTTAQAEVLMRIMQLVHAYGSFGQSDQSSSTTSSSLSVVA